MDLSLTRVDLLNVDAMKRSCLRVLPMPKKTSSRTQKVVVGDQAGNVHCFGMKKGDVVSVFKASMERPISRIETGGTLDERDKIFVAAGQTVHAWSRKGRLFLKFNTNLSEDIASMHVLNDDIFTGGEFTYNQFRACKDFHTILANDRINDLTAVFALPGAAEPSAVLACQDRTLRVLDGSEVVFEGQVDGPALTVLPFSSSAVVKAASLSSQFSTLAVEGVAGSPARRGAAGAELLYGTENGIFGQILLGDGAMRRGWEVGNRSVSTLANRAAAPRRAGGVTALCAHDLTHDGVPDVIVGRDDGTIQVYSFDVSADPTLCFERALSGSVTGVAAGLVNSFSFDEIVISTYAGQVVSFSSEPSQNMDLTGDDGKGLGDDDDEAKPGAGLKSMFGRGRKAAESPSVASTAIDAKAAADKKGAVAKRIKALEKEIGILKLQMDFDRERYSSSVSSEMIAVQTDLHLRDSFALSEDEACYRLQIEISKPLEFVLLQTDVPLELLDALRPEAGEDQAALDDASTAIVSRTRVGGSNQLLATYRVTENANRIEMRLRTIEGRYGSLQAYVIPKGKPKTARGITYQIRPLSLHRRLAFLPESAAARPLSELRVTGAFQLAEMHSWVYAALPEVPERVTADEMALNFKSTFLGTVLAASYRKGEALFRSDNLTTLTTIKEVVTREATQRKVQLKTAFDVKEEATAHMLALIDPLIAHQSGLAHKVRLTEALRELEQQEGDVSFLAPEYAEILTGAATIKSEFAQMPRQLDYLISIVIDLYADKYKYQGVDVDARLPQLDRLLRTDYSLEHVIQFFREI